MDEDAGIAACGDAVSRSDRRGLPPEYLVHPPQSTNLGHPPEGVVDIENNLATLLDYEFDVALVGHGSSMFEDADDHLRSYVDFEPVYVSNAVSMNRPSHLPHEETDADFSLYEDNR